MLLEGDVEGMESMYLTCDECFEVYRLTELGGSNIRICVVYQLEMFSVNVFVSGNIRTCHLTPFSIALLELTCLYLLLDLHWICAGLRESI